MQYKTVAFDPQIDRNNPTGSAAAALQSIVESHANEGWEFVGVQNHSTVIPGSNGCFGFGAQSSTNDTMSLVVFQK